MNPLSIIEPAANAAASPSRLMKEGEAQEVSVLFASLVDLVNPKPETKVLPADSAVVPVPSSLDDLDIDLQSPAVQTEAADTMATLSVPMPQKEVPQSTNGMLDAPRHALSPHPQRASSPEKSIGGNPAPAPPAPLAKGADPVPLVSAGLSSAQSMIEGRIMKLPKIVMGQAGEKPIIRTEIPAKAKQSGQPGGPLQPAATSVNQSIPKPAAPLAQMPDPVAPRARNLQERVTSGVSHLQPANAAALVPASFTVAAQPVVAKTQGSTAGVVEISEHTVKGLEQDGLSGFTGPDRTTTMVSAANSVMAAAPETARHAAHQIATAIVQANGKATEILLNPDELGRVRMSMSAVDGNLTLVVLADRPETQELLRRHIDVLAQEFKALGYDSVSFSFNADGQSGTDGTNDESGGDPTATMEKVTETEEETKPVLSSGLDLRL